MQDGVGTWLKALPEEQAETKVECLCGCLACVECTWQVPVCWWLALWKEQM
jgi:hypothetical protein